ncbi:MAG: hypothetical protein KF781_04065 [Chitinophagaceae bacterium]|nr:hypothetical protein [Chitinophagaceae bacterium]MCW5904738.1 hypothetical protein [Chitinophagaceae bacterium]
MTDNKNILPQNALSEKDLIDYVNNNLSAEKRHAIELQMAENNFMNDAVEGLEQFTNKQQIQEYVHELNHQLKKQTHKKRIRKHKRKLKEQDWIIIAAIILLLLSVTAYLLIQRID